MQASENDIENLHKRVTDMIQLLQKQKAGIATLKSEIEVLKAENQHLNKLLRIQKNSIKSLEQEVKTKKIATVLSKKDKTAAKLTLNKLIEEVDKCIKLVYSSQ